MSFRFQNRYLLLTYKTWIGPTFLEQFAARGWDISWCHEKGEDYEHTHVVVDFHKYFQTVKQSFFDIEGLHPHWKILNGKKAYADALEYCRKEGLEMLIKDISVTLSESYEGLTVVEALSRITELKNVIPVLALIKALPRPLPAPPVLELYGWELDVEAVLKTAPNRKIYWFWEPIGKVGKSTFARWMRLTYPNDVRVLQNPGGARDFATIVENLLASGWNGKLLILDLPRNAEGHSIYEPIESIKNGFLNSIKYQGQEIIMPCNCHVVVFANWLPDLDKVSRDRWVITNIRDFVITTTTATTAGRPVTPTAPEGRGPPDPPDLLTGESSSVTHCTPNLIVRKKKHRKDN